MADVKQILSSLGLTQDNSGVWTATGGWRKSAGSAMTSSGARPRTYSTSM